MAGIGILVNSGGADGYAYKVLVPPGALVNGIIDLSVAYYNLPGVVTNTIIDSITNKVHANAIHIKVKATQNILKGQPVKYIGYNSGEDAIEVALANQADSISIGIAAANMTTGSFGPIIAAGVLEGVDTSTHSNGQILYVDGTGVLTHIEPTTGYSQPIAFVLRAHQVNGAIQINAAYPKQRANDIFVDQIQGISSNKVQGVLEELAIKSFIDTFETTKRNADSINNTYIAGILTSQSIVENAQVVYTVSFSYTSGVLASKTISKTSGGSVTMTYNYNPDGSLASISQIGGD